MLGQQMFGHLSRRMDDVMNGGISTDPQYSNSDKPLMRMTNIFAIFGDHLQLDPVCDSPAFVPSSNTALKSFGANKTTRGPFLHCFDQPSSQDCCAGFAFGIRVNVKRDNPNEAESQILMVKTGRYKVLKCSFQHFVHCHVHSQR